MNSLLKKKCALFMSAVLLVGGSVSLFAQTTGPSSSASPYLVPANPAVSTTSLLTVGDSVNFKPDGVTPYRMVGIPDGLGAYDNGDNTFTLVMNHEIPVSVAGGVATPLGGFRAHGNAGAFVSRWIIDKATRQVLSVEDLLPNDTSIYLSNNNPGTGTVHTGYLAGGTTAIGRLCSADLGAPTAYAWTDPSTGTSYGTSARIFQTGEEMVGVATSITGGGNLGLEGRVDYGRQWNMILTDDPNTPGDDSRTAYEMPSCGLFNWENNLANPLAQRKTITVGMDDTSGAGQVYFWIGEKQTTGNVVERAGLTHQSANDNLWVVKVDGLTPDATGATNESRSTPLNGTFSLMKEGDVSGLTSLALESLSDSKGATQFLRPEDGNWDPVHPSDFYFVTTDQLDLVKDGLGSQVGRSRLYRLRFTDISNPELGGAIECLLDGSEAGNMFDNITVDTHGRILLQEDVGNAAHLGKVWMYEIATDRLVLIARHDPFRFGDIGVPATAPFNQDEESSGIIDVSSIFGPGSYLLDVQAHYNPGDAELVEGGQLLLVNVPVAPTVNTVQINDGNVQRSRVRSLTVTFNGTIPAANIASGAFTLTKAGGGTFSTDVTSVSSANGQTSVTLGFSGVGVGTDGSLPDGTYNLSVDASKVTDQLGQSVDTNNDGFAGGPVTVISSFKTLFGDLNGDGAVSKDEVRAAEKVKGAHLGDANYFWYLDFNADGIINGLDVKEVERRRTI